MRTRFLLLATLTLVVLGYAEPSHAAQRPALTQLAESETFETTNLSAPERAEILTQIEAVSFDVPDSWSGELRARRVSLGASDGLVVQGRHLLCGATGNCQIFVFARRAGKWQILFDMTAPLANAFDFIPASGIADFMVSTNLSAELTEYKRYGFSGQYYRAKSCFRRAGNSADMPCTNP